MLAAIVETSKLGKVVAYSLLTGVGISIVFSLGVSGAAGLIEALRERRTAAVIGWGALAGICGVVALGAVVLGIVIMSTK
jgi:cytochrome c biogenesis protein CcdA